MKIQTDTPKINGLEGKPFSRRAALTGLMVAAATPAAAFQAPITETPEPDPIRRWLDQWKARRADLDLTEEHTPEDAACFADMNALEDRIAETPARTRDGLMAQLEWILADTAPDCFPCPQHREALELAVAAMKGGLV